MKEVIALGNIEFDKDDVYDRVNQELIIRSNTWLYFTEDNKFQRNVDPIKTFYRPYTLAEAEKLKILVKAMTGDIVAKRSYVYKRSLVRYGWIEKTLNNLRWRNLEDLVNEYRAGTISRSDKTKLSAVCRLLFISIKDIC